MKSKRTLGVALVLAALLAFPGAAFGKSEPGLAFHLPGSNGYEISVSGEGATAFISAERQNGSSRGKASSTYIARGKVSATAIKASFDDLGRVAMRFQPSGRVVHSKPGRNCRGADRYTIRFGVFVGSVRFRGEGGYTAVNAHRVKGKVIAPPFLRCASPPAAGGRRGHHTGTEQGNAARTTLFAHWHSGVSAMYFLAAVDGSRTRFLAATERTEGSLAIYRSAFAVASPHAFTSDSALSFATVNPPAPFGGTGSLQRDTNGARLWTGSLTVSFPGEPDVPLTGSQFKTQLVRSW